MPKAPPADAVPAQNAAAGPAETRLNRILDRIAGENDRSCIFLDLDPGGARAAARLSDARAPLGPLDGKIVAVKANLAVRGLPWSAGTAGWRYRVAAQDAGAVAKLRAAGAIVLGTVNMDEGALGASGDNPVFGRCRNPLDPALSPGGSSGGSAAAVAAGLADLALGTDTMGSIRLPAAYCGLAGLKPTRGLIGRSGLAHLAPSLDALGPIAATAAALDAPLQLLARADPADSADPDWMSSTLGAPVALAGIRIGILPPPAGDLALKRGLDRVQHAAAELGALLVATDLPGWEPGPARRAGLLLAEAEGALALADLLERPGALSPDLTAALQFGQTASSAKLIAALARIRAAAMAAHRALAALDALLLPTAPQGPFRHGTSAPPDQADFTALASFAGLPALAFPVPDPKGGLPGSVQLIGHAYSDRRLIGWAAALQDALGT
ncbi:MAG: amidase [Pseudomonadota bacterium]